MAKKAHTPLQIKEKKMIHLNEKGTNKPLGDISEAQLQFLTDSRKSGLKITIMPSPPWWLILSRLKAPIWDW
jgi:hypothetical protein